MAAPLSSLRLSKHLIPRHGNIPNTSISSIPFIHYKSVFSPSSSIPTSTIESIISSNSWAPSWKYTMYSTSHFHSTTHEFLTILHGSARLLIGGDDNTNALKIRVNAGDAMFMPAGVSHRLVEDLEGGFLMLGSYPKEVAEGVGWDMCYGRDGEDIKGIEARIRGLKEVVDPIYGREGPGGKVAASHDEL